MSYNVVLEIDETEGGLFGSRNHVPYTAKEKFDEQSIVGQKIIAQGVSDEEAKNLVNLTPEVCILMGLIEQCYQDNPKITTEELRSTISIYRNYFISESRIHIETHSLTRIDARKYIAHFRKMILDDPWSLKSASMRGVMVNLLDEYTGEVT
mgnify:CR=1 FL=1